MSASPNNRYTHIFSGKDRPGSSFTCLRLAVCKRSFMPSPSEIFAFQSYSKTRTTIGTGGFGPGYEATRARTSMAHTSGTTGAHSHRMLKKPTFSPAQSRRLLHPPALSLPRQPLRPGTRLGPVKAAASNQRWFFQACSCTLPRMARMSPPLRATVFTRAPTGTLRRPIRPFQGLPIFPT